MRTHTATRRWAIPKSGVSRFSGLAGESVADGGTRKVLVIELAHPLLVQVLARDEGCLRATLFAFHAEGHGFVQLASALRARLRVLCDQRLDHPHPRAHPQKIFHEV